MGKFLLSGGLGIAKGCRAACMAAFVVLMGVIAPSVVSAQGQSRQSVESSRIRFEINKSTVSRALDGNAAALDSIERLLRRVSADESLTIDSIAYRGSASPEGPRAFNELLAEARLEALERYVRSLLPALSHVPSSHSSAVAGQEQVVAETAAGASVGRAYRRLRFSTADFYLSTFEPRPLPPLVPTQDRLQSVLGPRCEFPEPYVLPMPAPRYSKPVPDCGPANGSLYVKTNFVGWGMLVSNLALEVDFASRWSLSVPIYYSGVNFFKITSKFRTLTVQPEVRFWFGGPCRYNSHWFVGAHLGTGFYNFANGVEYRIQDHNGRTPAYGGGLAVGYRWRLNKSGSFNLEFTLGGGAYRVNYDKYYNMHNGALVESGIKKTYLGVDQAAITLSWRVAKPRKKGGGK